MKIEYNSGAVRPVSVARVGMKSVAPAQDIPVAKPSMMAEGTIVYQLGQRLAIA